MTEASLGELLRAAEAIASARGAPEILRRLVEAALELVGGERGAWRLAGDGAAPAEELRGGAWQPTGAGFERAAAGALELPILDRDGEPLGAFAISRAAGAAAWSEAERALLQGLATLAATALDNEHARRTAEDDAASRQRAHATLEAVIEASPAAIMLLDLDGTVRLWNEAAVATFGWTRDEVVGRFLPSVEASRRDEFLANLRTIGGGHRIVGVETIRHKKGGVPFHAQLFASPVRGPHGTIQCMSVVLDVTERTLENLRSQFLADASTLMASAPGFEEVFARLAALAVPRLADWCLVDRVDGDGALDRVVVAHADPADAPTAAALRRRLAPLARVPEGVDAVVARGHVQLARDVDDALLRRIARDDAHLAALRGMRMISYVSAPLLVGGRPLGAFTLASKTRRFDEHDVRLVTDVVTRVASLLESARLSEQTRSLVHRLERIQDATAELSRARTPAEVATTIVRNGAQAVGAEAAAVWLEQADGTLRLLEATGSIPADVLDTWRVLAPSSALPGVRVVTTGAPEWIETLEQYRAAAPAIVDRVAARGRLCAFAALPLAVGAGRRGLLVFTFPLGHRFLAEDRRYILTLARQCQQAVERAELYAREAEARARAEVAQAQSEAASRAKDEFLAMLGHELRNPIAPIVTALELMKLRGAGDSKEVTIIGRQVEHLVRLVDDLLDLSRITRGKIELDRQQVEVAGAVARAVEIASPLLEQRGHRLVIDVASGLCVDADPVRLTQVISNLVTNAAKYTPREGAIEITARAQGEDGVIRVRDNGAGIDPALLPHLFEPFTQGPRTLDRAEGGLGIGLALVKNLVAMHGGSVEARSEGAGKGSEFIVRWPMRAREPRRAARAGTAPGLSRKKRGVLVVDDNRDAADMIAALLESAGHEVRVAYDGPQALAVVQRFTPQVAILDIGLPVMDGYELASRLRALPFAHDLKLLALTGYGQEQDRARSASAGFAAHLVKPVSPELLRRYVDE